MSKPRYHCVADIFLENEYHEVLMIKRALRKNVLPDCYNGIGGKIEPGETPLQAILRETKEESGVNRVENLKMRAVLSVKDKFGFWQIYIFQGKILKKAAKVQEISEGKLEWIKKSQLNKIKLVPDVKQWIDKMYQNPNSLIFANIEYTPTYKLKKCKMYNL